MNKLFLTPLIALSLASAAHAVTVTLGDPTLNASSNDGWASNSHVLTNNSGNTGITYAYTNTSGAAETITPSSWSYFIQGGAGADFSTFNVTPFLVSVNDAGEGNYTVLGIGDTRIGGAGNDFDAAGAYTSPWGSGGSFTIANGITIGIGAIDSNATGTGPAHTPAGGIIPFDGDAGGDLNHWYNGDPAQNTYPNGTPGGVGIGGALAGVENADINRNYQFNITFDASPVPEPSAALLGLLGLAFLIRRRR